MAPSQHKALLLESKFGKFVVNTVDVPKPSAGEILVKVQAAALNPIDWKVQKYGLFVDQFPVVLGKDLAGDVVEVGEGVANVAVGDRVFIQSDLTKEQGAFQQYAIAKAPLFAKIPHNLTYDDASTLPIALVTAYLGLFQDPQGFGLPNLLTEGLNKSSGQTIVILGGASSVGQFVIQLAKLAGFSTIITTASLKHTEWLKSLGATHVIDRNTPSLSVDVSGITGSQTVKYIYDAISVPETQQAGYNLLASDGEIVVLIPDAIKNKVEGKKVRFILAVASLPENREVLITFFTKITSLLEEGVIKPSPVQVLPDGLAGIQEGLRKLENNEVSGAKLVARPQETA